MAAYKDEARGTWYVSFHYNDWTGKNKRKLKRGFRTRKEALEYEQKFLLQQATNLDMRFEDFYKLYEEDLKPKLKLNTFLIPSFVMIRTLRMTSLMFPGMSQSWKTMTLRTTRQKRNIISVNTRIMRQSRSLSPTFRCLMTI